MSEANASEDDDMHRNVSWLKPADRPILRAIAEIDAWIRPSSLYLNVSYSNYTVAERCRVLHQHDLLERFKDNIPAYRITNRGRAFLRDELEPEDLRTNS